MADKNIQMTQRNTTNDGWDNLYPKTKASNVTFADGTTVESHQADDTSHVRYGSASGTNAKTITLNPAPTALVEGFAVSFKNATQNTGAVTLNVNGLGAKSVLKPNGTALASGNLKANSIYTVRYSGTAFILQGEGGEYGNATPEDVLQGILFGTEEGIKTGTLIPGKKWAGGISSTQWIAGFATAAFSITGLDFQPRTIAIHIYRSGTKMFSYSFINGIHLNSQDGGSSIVTSCTLNPSGFTVGIRNSLAAQYDFFVEYECIN